MPAPKPAIRARAANRNPSAEGQGRERHVREGRAKAVAATAESKPASLLADASAERVANSKLPIYLNVRWRVSCDSIQWFLEYRRGNKDPKSTGWRARRFHLERDSLLRSITCLCGQADLESIELIKLFPQRFPSGVR